MDDYGILAIGGLGNVWRLDTLDDEHPPNPKRYTLEAAKKFARYWGGIADTIGGRANVIQLSTGKIVFRG
jgi:hypothetical protein